MEESKKHRYLIETNSERHDRHMLPYPDNLIAEIKALPYENSDPTLASENLTMEDLEYGLSHLRKRPKEFLMFRFKEHLTYKATGEHMGVSTERARQVVLHDLRKIRWHLKRKLMEIHRNDEKASGGTDSSSRKDL